MSDVENKTESPDGLAIKALKSELKRVETCLNSDLTLLEYAEVLRGSILILKANQLKKTN